MRPCEDRRKFVVFGHRGAAGHAPENTLLSFEKALALRADLVETDVRVSADGIPILLHDETLERTTTGRNAARKRGVRFGRPSKLSAEQIDLGRRLIAEGRSVRDVARVLTCHHATLYRALSSAIDGEEGNGEGLALR